MVGGVPPYTIVPLDAVMVRVGLAVAVTVAVPVTGVELKLAVPLAVLDTEPLVMSAEAMVWLAVQLITPAGARVAGKVPQLRSLTEESVTSGVLSVTLPSLVSLIVYVMTWPRALYVDRSSVLVTVRCGSATL